MLERENWSQTNSQREKHCKDAVDGVLGRESYFPGEKGLYGNNRYKRSIRLWKCPETTSQSKTKVLFSVNFFYRVLLELNMAPWKSRACFSKL